MRSDALALAGATASRSCAISSAVWRSSAVCTPRDGRIEIGGSAPGGSGRKAVAAEGAFAKTIAAVAAATAAGARTSARRRSSGRGTSRSSGIAVQTIASAPSSATFAANSVVVGAMSTAASSPSETA